uniref:OTU domain-containing protein n=1 Tax=Trichogramma kaykai TaxID=54128 RepID=A0ABD2X705_9HYME
MVPPRGPAMQVENLDLQQMECPGIQDDLISFQEDPGDPTPAAPIAQSSTENENLPPNDVCESTLDPNEQPYVRRSFPEIAREISAKLRVDLRENSAPNRRGLQIDIWEVGSDDERPREVDEQNNDTRFAKNFDELADATKEYRDPSDHRANRRIRRLAGYSEHSECADSHATLMRSDDIPDKPPGNCLFYSLLKIFKSDLTAWELRQCLLRSPFVDTCDDPRGVREILQSPSQWGDIDCLYIFAHSFEINVCIHFEAEPQEYIYPRFTVNDKARYIHLHLSKKHYTPYIPVAIATLHNAEDSDSYKHAQEIGNSTPDALGEQRKNSGSQAKSADRHATGIIESPEQNRCAATTPAAALSTPSQDFTSREDRLEPRTMHKTRSMQRDQSAQHCTLDYDTQMNDNTELLVPAYECNGDNTPMCVEPFNTNLPDNELLFQEITDAREHNIPARDTSGSIRQNADAAQVGKEGDDVQQGHTNAALCKYYVAKCRPPRDKPPWHDDGLNGFGGLKISKDHPFKYRENLAFVMSHFREGQMVMLLKEPRANKFSEEYSGPYEIVHVDHEGKSVVLLRNGTERKVHIDKIKPAYAQKPTKQRVDDIDMNGNEGMSLRSSQAQP